MFRSYLPLKNWTYAECLLGREVRGSYYTCRVLDFELGCDNQRADLVGYAGAHHRKLNIVKGAALIRGRDRALDN